MNFLSYIKNSKLKIIVRPNSPKNRIIGWNKEKQALKVNIKALPEKGKANVEIIKFFSRLAKKQVKIVSGKTSKTKIISF